MAQLQAELLAQVESAAVEFIDTCPASRPPSPKSDDEIKKQHVVFETRKGFFSNKVEEAEIQFLMAMEMIEYGEAKTKRGQSFKKMLESAEKARLAAEAVAKQLEEDARKAKADAARLQAELDKLLAMGSGDKRWKSEKVTVMLGDDPLKPDEFECAVLDKGAEINIDINVSQSRAGSPDEANHLRDEMKKAQEALAAEGKRLTDELKIAQEERDKLAAELAKLQAMGGGGKRWKSETVSIVIGNKSLSQDEFKFEVLDKGAEINIDINVSQNNEAAGKAKAEAEAKQLRDEMKKAQEALAAESQRLTDELKKAQEERDKLAAEMAKLQAMAGVGKRWKSETVSVVMGNKPLSKDEFKFEVLDKGAQIDIDVQIQGMKIASELEAVKKNLLEDETHALIKTNIKEVLEHLENIAEVVQPKSSRAGPSKHDVDSGGHS